MDFIYYLVQFLTILGLPIAGVIVLSAVAKPHLVNNRKIIQSEYSRRRIAGVGIASLVLALVSFGGVMAATEPTAVKQERLASASVKAQQETTLKEALAAKKAAFVIAEKKRLAEESTPVIKTEVSTQRVSFDTTEVSDNTITSGERRVTTAGVDGQRTITTEVTYVRDVETSRRQVLSEISTQPISQVISVGTYVKPSPASSYSAGGTKMSRTGICHAPGSTYYNQTKYYDSYETIQACLNAGGRMPKR